MPLGLMVTDIVKDYEGSRVLDSLSYTFTAGKTHLLMGANGCGKSTLLRICALLDQPDAGNLTFLSNGDVAPIDLDLQRRITLVLPKVGVFNDSVARNVAYGLKIRGIAKQERVERVDAMLSFIGLAHKRNQNALTLSSGETHRLGIGRALVVNPDLLFLDEPTTSIDQKNIEHIEQIILTMKEAGQPTIIMTTHDRQQAERLSNRVLFMREGKISPDEQNTRTA
jgi:tungstate transport system ATP-binding protein